MFTSFKMSSAKVFKRIKYEPITVKEPHKYNVMEFADPEEFTAYYRENEDKFKGVSTLALNKTYKIPGYRISLQNKGKENEELILKKDYYGGRFDALSPMQVPAAGEPLAPLSELIARIENIEHYLEQLKI
jgi:hypothetical protein